MLFGKKNDDKSKKKALQLQPKILKILPKYTDICQPELKQLLVEKYIAQKQVNDQSKMTSELMDEFYVDQCAIALAYFSKPGESMGPKNVRKLMLECAKEAGLEDE